MIVSNNQKCYLSHLNAYVNPCCSLSWIHFPLLPTVAKLLIKLRFSAWENVSLLYVAVLQPRVLSSGVYLLSSFSSLKLHLTCSIRGEVSKYPSHSQPSSKANDLLFLYDNPVPWILKLHVREDESPYAQTRCILIEF